MGNCWSKEGGKVTYSQKRDRIKMWVDSQPNMEEIRSNPERTKLVRIKGMSDISVLSPALAMSKTSLNSSMSISSCVFFDARDYADSDDEESAYDDALEVVVGYSGLRALGGGGSCLRLRQRQKELTCGTCSVRILGTISVRSPCLSL